jgi:broad specificity phosphatase PhoE
MITQEQFSELLDALHGIRHALEARQPAIAQQTRPSVAAGAVLVPMPADIVQDAANVEIHFGKNKGRTLGSLSAKSLEWYAAEKPPQLKNDGTPFALRPEDLRLVNAARTLHHKFGSASVLETSPISQAPIIDEEVPF